MKIEYGFDKLVEVRKIIDNMSYLNYTEAAKRCNVNTTELNRWARQWFDLTGCQLTLAICQKKQLKNNFPRVVGFKQVDQELLPKIELENNHELNNNIMVIEYPDNRLEYVAGVYRRGMYRRAIRFSSAEVDALGLRSHGIYNSKLVRDSGMAEAMAIHAFLEQLWLSR